MERNRETGSHAITVNTQNMRFGDWCVPEMKRHRCQTVTSTQGWWIPTLKEEGELVIGSSHVRALECNECEVGKGHDHSHTEAVIERNKHEERRQQDLVHHVHLTKRSK